MVLLPSTDPVDGQAVFDYLRAHWNDLPSIADVETRDAVVTGRIAGGMLAVMQLPVPVPPGDLTGPAKIAWHWPEAAAALAEHKSHVIVHAASAELGLLDLRLLHTKLIASVVAVSGAIGVYIGDALLVRSADHYLSYARAASREELPLLLWVGFNLVAEDDGGRSAYTTGLTGFGLHELEVHRSSRPPAELLGGMADAANYELSTGNVLADGDTFGASEDERIRVRYVSSEFLPDTTVALLDL